MSKIFEFDTRKGSLIDKVSGNVLTNTDVEIKNTEKGRSARFNGNTSKLDHSTTQSYAMNTAFTIEIYLNLFDSETNSRHILADDAVDASSRIYYSAVSNRLIFNDSNNGDCFGSKSLNSYTWYHVMIINDGAGNVNFVVNNIDDIDTITTANLFNFNTIGGIRGEATAVEAFFGDISIVGTYDKALNAQERQNLYNDFLRSSNISRALTLKQKVQHKAIAQQPELSLFHNYENGNSIDATNNNFDGADTAIDYGIEGARFNGSSSKIDAGDIGNIQAVTFLVKPRTTTEYLFQADTAKYVYVNAGTVTYSGITEVATYINGVATTSIPTADIEYYITCVFTQVDALNFEIGTDGSNYLDGSIKFIKTQDGVKTLVEHKAEYNRYAKQVVFNEYMTNQNADGKIYEAGMILPNGWIINSGKFEILETPKQVILNPDFTTNLDGWVNEGDWAWDSGSARLTTSTVNKKLAQTVAPLKTGKTYRIQMTFFNHDMSTSKNMFYRHGSVLVYTSIPANSEVIVDETFVADGVYFAFGNSSTIADVSVDYCYVSEVQVFQNGIKRIRCINAGSISIGGIDLSAYIGNGYIAAMDTTGLASDEGSTVDDATNVSFADNVLTIANFTTGDKLSNIKISKGVVV